MKKLMPWLIVSVALLIAMGGVATAAENQTWNGEYNWNNGGEGPLKGVFTARGEDSWKVAFHFRFNGKKYVYKGTAEGSLSGGRLAGEVTHRGRRWTFEGTVKDGTFQGSHTEMGQDGAFETGTMTLSRPSADEG